MPVIELNGPIYPPFAGSQGYTSGTEECIVETVKKLLEIPTTVERPGMLLGMIQSGKTRTFFGITALSFDNGYDITIVLTKGTIALTQQTYERFMDSFKDFMESDSIRVFDVMHLPSNLTEYELRQKIIIVCKKEDDNLRRLDKALFDTYPELGKKKVLIIDDEADFASIGFRRTKAEGVKINVIARQIDLLRKKLNKPSFLQVTATPYSLYLQPTDLEIEGIKETFRPIKPAFTVLVPVYEKYVGGDFYFKESLDTASLASYVYEEVGPKELEVLRKDDRRKLKPEEALISKAIPALRDAIVNFVVGSCIRRLQLKSEGSKLKKLSFIVHTERKREAHEWQVEIVTALRDKLIEARDYDNETLDRLIRGAYCNISSSMETLGYDIPDFELVKDEVYSNLDALCISKVNCDNDIKELLDETGQLKLRTPLNIFVGGQILDRGLTIGNLIGFYYGRNPRRYQQDTVLQHSRMYGNRPLEDLAVTRFYTSPRIYSAMKKIFDFDTALREAFEKPVDEAGVVFIHKDETNTLIPCSPNKIILSSITTLKPGSRLLPVGFQSKRKTEIEKSVQEVDLLLETASGGDFEDAFLIDIELALLILDKISHIFDFGETGYVWDVEAFKESLRYTSSNSTDVNMRGKVHCLVRKPRYLTRFRPGGRFSDAPDSYEERELTKRIALVVPCLLLIREAGRSEDGWGGFDFWWPVLRMPQNMNTVVFSSEVADY